MIHKHCATCGKTLEKTAFTFKESKLLGIIFFELDGSDNVFCSHNCACDALSIAVIENN
jgi:hypothetical protein